MEIQSCQVSWEFPEPAGLDMNILFMIRIYFGEIWSISFKFMHFGDLAWDLEDTPVLHWAINLHNIAV